jgi:hypothetical protein
VVFAGGSAGWGGGAYLYARLLIDCMTVHVLGAREHTTILIATTTPQVLVMEAGKCAEYGSPQELLSHDDSLLSALVDAQVRKCTPRATSGGDALRSWKFRSIVAGRAVVVLQILWEVGRVLFCDTSPSLYT